MSNIFNEVYGTYYNVVAKILKEAVNGELTSRKLQNIVYDNGYGESLLQLLPALQEGKWQLLTPELETPVMNEPKMPLTMLQKRWLKTVLMDKRVRLFVEDEVLSEMESQLRVIKPLYSMDSFVFYDRYIDGDDFENIAYIRNFKSLVAAIKNKNKVSVSYRNNKQKISIWEELIPTDLEYSAKDDKFRLQCIEGKRRITLNLGKMIDVELGEHFEVECLASVPEEPQKKVVMELVDERKTLERALIHFSDLAKETDRLDDTHYRLTIYYDKCDETELLFRILSFGPTVIVKEPESFVELIKKQLREQLACRLGA